MRQSRLCQAGLIVSGLFLALTMTLAAGLETKPAAGPNGSAAGIKLTDLDGFPHTIGRESTVGTVLIFLSTDCPIANKSVPELNRLAKVAADGHMAFFGVISDAATTRAEALKHHAEYKFNFPELFDASGTLAAALGPTTTPHAFLVGPDGKIVYSGRIDDSYAGVSKPNAETRTHDLENAMGAVAAGKTVAVPFAQPVGCIFEGWQRKAADAKVTYTRDIAPILNTNCVECHRDGEVAPFTLTGYKEAAKHAKMLAMVCGMTPAVMPPWKSTDPLGTFRDERHLTAAEIDLLQQWADAGAPEGDAADLPTPPKFADGWSLGKPDVVIKMPQPFAVPAASKDIIRYFVIPIDLEKDQQVIGFEFRPGNRKVVHHMIAFLDSTGRGREIAKERGDGVSYASFGGPGFVPAGGLGGWAPGTEPHLMPDGAGRKLKKGSDLVMQIHYHPDGKDETDQGELALYFAKTPLKRLAIDIPMGTRNIDIAAGDANYVRTAEITTPVDVTLFGIMPHMHNVAKSMKVTATYKDGTTRVLINVQDWDWNWQEQYQYAAPVKIPAGTKIDLEAHYDNSEKNPRNPNSPPKRIRNGEQTTDEMCLCFLQITVDGLLGERLLQLDVPRPRLLRPKADPPATSAGAAVGDP